MKKYLLSILLSTSIASGALAAPVAAVMSPKILKLPMPYVQEVLGKSDATMAMGPLNFHTYKKEHCLLVVKEIKNKVVGLTVKNDASCQLSLHQFGLKTTTASVTIKDVLLNKKSTVNFDDGVTIELPVPGGEVLFKAPDSINTQAGVLKKKHQDMSLLKNEMINLVQALKPVSISIETIE